MGHSLMLRALMDGKAAQGLPALSSLAVFVSLECVMKTLETLGVC